jgi:uncharacterized membrane protein
MKAEFDSTYPVHLNGIISQEEYRASIDRINRTISSDRTLIILLIVSNVILTGGTVLSIVTSPAVSKETPAVVVFALIGVGLAMMILALILSCIAIRIAFRRPAHLRQAIAEESMKYSSRSPTSCSWRLEPGVSGGYAGSINRVSIVLFYQYL